MPDAIVAENVGKRYRRYYMDRPLTIHEALLRGFRKLGTADHFWGLRGVNFRIAAGRMVGVLGRNGAGKSTLLRLLGGVGKPDEGSIKIHGRMGALLTLGAGFHQELTGRENLRINGIISGLTRSELEERYQSIVEFSELQSYMESPLRTYSSGMNMRLAFSVAIHSDPDIMLIDEVLAVGDLAFQRKCMNRIEEMKRRGCTIIVVSHDVGVMKDLCDEILWFRDGRLAAHGPAALVAGQYLDEVNSQSWGTLQVSNPESKPADATANSASSPQPADVAPSASHNADSGSGISTPSPDGALSPAPAPPASAPRPNLQIVEVRLLDSNGDRTAEIEPGAPLVLEIAFVANTPLVNLNFSIYVYREDGVACFELGTEAGESGLDEALGEGQMVLHLEQLDLAGGIYHVDVGAAASPAGSFDYRTRMASFTVRPTGTAKGILLPPHRWDVRYAAPEKQ
jgi:lipopolysaccharide transport system ATP-binding protein